MAYTVGSVLGPTIGGLLGASGDYYFGAKIAVVGSLLSVVLTLFMPNDSPSSSSSSNGGSSEAQVKGVAADGKQMGTTTTSTTTTSTSSAPEAKPSTTAIPTAWEVVRVVWLFLSTKIITSVANAIAAAALPLILKNTYGMDERALGFTMSAMSFCNAIVNGLFLAPIIGLAHGDLKLVISVCIACGCVLSGIQATVAHPALSLFSPFAAAGGLYEFIALTFVLSMFQYVLGTTITGESTARVGPLAKGTLIGLEHSMFAAARVFTPQAAVLILKAGGVSAVCGTCSLIFGAVYVAWTAFKDRAPATIGSCLGGGGILSPNGSSADERKEK
jgi:hypothetical protein